MVRERNFELEFVKVALLAEIAFVIELRFSR